MDPAFSEIALKIIVILAGAKLLVALGERFGQDAVVGELLLGIVLGPYMLGLIDPKGEAVLAFLSELGIIVLAFYVGLSAELEPLLNAWRPALRVAALGTILPLAFGALFGLGVGLSLSSALFIGGALSATSLGKVGRLLLKTGRIQSLSGSVILGAALLDDLLALWLLAGFHAWLAPRPLNWATLAFEGVFSLLAIVFSLAIGVRWAPRLFRFIERLETRGVIIVSALVFCLGMAVLAKSIGLATVVGAFIAGLMLEYVHHEKQITRQTETLVDLFVPFYFVKAGALFDPTALLQIPALLSVLTLFLLAALGKLLSGFGAGKADKRLVGIGMMPRGEVTLIFATFGLEAGLLNKELYTVLVVVILLTSIITPILLRVFLRRA